jgi:hypothetical protein
MPRGATAPAATRLDRWEAAGAAKDACDHILPTSVHRHLFVEGTLVRDNPFHIPAEKFLPLSPAEKAKARQEGRA